MAAAPKISAPVKNLIESLNGIILKIIGYVMKFAPLGVFALMADLVVSFAGDSDLLLALGYYALTVVIGLVFILLVCYPLIVRFFSRTKLGDYMRAVLPVQLLAFTSCSSAACLPVNMEQMRKLGLPHNVISFVLPTGITINESCLMQPIKSVSGIIGIGDEVRKRSYGCDICNSTSCAYRNIRKKKQ